MSDPISNDDSPWNPWGTWEPAPGDRRGDAWLASQLGAPLDTAAEDSVWAAAATSPWAAPDPATRLIPVVPPLGPVGPFGAPGPMDGPGGHRVRSRRRLTVAAAIAAAALVSGATAVALTGHDDRSSAPPSSSRSSAAPSPSSTGPVLTLPQRRFPTTPSTSSVSSPELPGSSSTTPGTVAPTRTSPNPASPSSTPAAPASPSTTAGRTTSSSQSLSAGVVDVDTVLKYQQSEAAGTGIVLTAAGEILTNNHVVEGATSISVTVVATGKSYVATVVGTDASHDVAVLQLKGASGLTPAHLGTSGHVAVGDAVTAVGNAGGRGGTPTVATGQVTALGQSITATDDLGGHVEQLTNLIQVDAPLQPGESGGPLYDAKGEVIGMDTAGSAIRRSRTRSTEGFAIPIDDALAVAKRIETGQSGGGVVIGSPGFLGVGVQDATTRSGAEVTQIVSGSPAAAIGLQVGDVLVGVDGKTITSADTVAGALQAHHAGDAVKVAWVDQSGGQHSATATLIEGPAR